MADATHPHPKTSPRSALSLPQRDIRKSTTTYLMWGVFAMILMWAWEGSDIRPMALITDAGNMREYAAGFFPPDFHFWDLFLEEMLITVQIAIWGTVLAIILGIPFGILSSENVAPVWVYWPIRRLMDAARAINELVFAMLFVVAVGVTASNCFAVHAVSGSHAESADGSLSELAMKNPVPHCVRFVQLRSEYRVAGVDS